MHNLTIWQWVALSVAGVCSGLILRWFVQRRQLPTEPFPLGLRPVKDDGVVGVQLNFLLRLFFVLSVSSEIWSTNKFRDSNETLYLPWAMQVIHTPVQSGSLVTVRFSLLFVHFAVAVFFPF